MGKGNILTGMMTGHLMTTDNGRAEAAADVARVSAQHAQMQAQAQEHTAELALMVRATQNSRDSWRNRATMLAVNTRARKMSEDALIAALAAENANHPLASREAFEKVVVENLAKENVKRQADFDGYCKDIEKRLPDA